MKSLIKVILFIFLIQYSGLSQGVSEIKIWDEAPHNAFTDLIRYKSYFYCTFREGVNHKPSQDSEIGKVRILRSRDGKKWESVILFQKNQYDLRDPKLSITPDNRLMVLMGGSKYINTERVGSVSFVSFSKNGLEFTEPETTRIEDSIKSIYDWIWRVTWHKGVGYGVVYQDPKLNKNLNIRLIKTTDGLNYQFICDLPVTNSPNEATIRFTRKDEMLMLVRREYMANGMIGFSKAPYLDWRWEELILRLGGPNFETLKNGSLLIGTRIYTDKIKEFDHLTHIMETNRTGEIKKDYPLRSSGDTGYPGMLKYRQNYWISYYSSHEGKASIYLTKLKLRNLKSKSI